MQCALQTYSTCMPTQQAVCMYMPNRATPSSRPSTHLLPPLLQLALCRPQALCHGLARFAHPRGLHCQGRAAAVVGTSMNGSGACACIARAGQQQCLGPACMVQVPCALPGRAAARLTWRQFTANTARATGHAAPAHLCIGGIQALPQVGVVCAGRAQLQRGVMEAAAGRSTAVQMPAPRMLPADRMRQVGGCVKVQPCIIDSLESAPAPSARSSQWHPPPPAAPSCRSSWDYWP